MVKSKNTPKNGSNKFRATVTISPELHDRVKESGLNLSRFTENSLNWLFSQIDNGNITLLSGNNLILSPELEKELQNNGSGATRTPELRRVKATSILSPELETAPEMPVSDFSTPRGKRSIADLMEDADTQRDYVAFMKKTGVAVGAQRDYVNSLMRLEDVYSPMDLSDYKEAHKKPITDKQRKGLLKLFKYLETRQCKVELNGFPFGVWRANLTITEKGAEKMRARVKDLTDEEVREARGRIEAADARDYFTLLAYSGARHKHLFEALRKKRPIHHAGKSVIYLEVSDLSAGTKRESRFYFPAAAEPMLRSLKIKHAYDYYLDKITEAAEGRPINAASLRKWQYSLMLTGEPNISAMAADQIQGRTPKTVGAAHYADLDKIAEEGYVKVAAKILAALPIET